MKTVGLWVAGILILVGIGGGFWWWRTRPRPVEIAAVRVGPALQLVYATGVVETDQPVSVAARLTAPVRAVLVDEGDRVRRGQALVLLDDQDQRAFLAQSRAQARDAAMAEARIVPLFKQGWATRAARDTAVATADAARAAEAMAAAHVGQSVVRAGIAGIVLKRDVEPGDTAMPGRELMKLGDPARLRVTATIDERDMPVVRVGQAALLSSDAWSGRVLHGRVRQITPGGDPDQRAFRVRLAMADAPTMPIGMTLEVNIVARWVDRATLVPTGALSGQNLRLVERGRAVRRSVRVGIVGAQQTQIEAGVRPGEQVITAPPADLHDGDRVASVPK